MDEDTRSCAKRCSRYVSFHPLHIFRHHCVELKSQVPDETALRGLSEALQKAEIQHHLWVEEP